METILVAGANGTTGREIIKLLKDSIDYRPLAMIRDEEQSAYFEMENVDTILGDLEGDLTEVVKNVDRVIFAAGAGGGASEQQTTDIDQKGAINLIDQSKGAGVRKFVMLSSMGTDNPSQMPELEHYLNAKKTADDHLKACFLEYTIVRPGALTNDAKTNKIKAKEHLNENGKISRKDVAQVLVNSLPPNMVKNKTFEILSGDTAIEFALAEVE